MLYMDVPSVGSEGQNAIFRKDINSWIKVWKCICGFVPELLFLTQSLSPLPQQSRDYMIKAKWTQTHCMWIKACCFFSYHGYGDELAKMEQRRTIGSAAT